MLETVTKEGKYARDEAAVLLVMLYNREKRMNDCLKILQDLTERFPGNSLFRLEMASTLGQLGHFDESSHVFESLLRNQA